MWLKMEDCQRKATIAVKLGFVYAVHSDRYNRCIFVFTIMILTSIKKVCTENIPLLQVPDVQDYSIIL